MPKRLRDEPIYLAPDILGLHDDRYNPVITDLRTNTKLDTYNIDDKFKFYFSREMFHKIDVITFGEVKLFYLTFPF